jgi:hypothetical protein
MGLRALDMFWTMRKRDVADTNLPNYKPKTINKVNIYPPDYLKDPTGENMEDLKNDILMIFEASELKFSEKILPLGDFRIPKLIIDTSSSSRRRKLFQRFILEELSSRKLNDACNLCGWESLVDIMELEKAESKLLHV